MTILQGQIRSMDVLCGKDKACLQAEGSKHFRDVIDSYVPRYAQCASKYDKMVITREIYEVVSETSRFLKFDEKEQVWEEISPMAARDKVGHALRFASRAKRRMKKNQKKTTTTTHKRSGSVSSTSSSSSSEAENANSLVGMIRNGMLSTPLNNYTNSLEEQPGVSPMPVLEAQPEAVSFDPLDEFLNLELQFEPESYRPSGSDATIFDDLKVLIEEKVECSDPLDNFMDDILHVVKLIERQEESCHNMKEEDSLLSLLSEPVGEWDEDRSVELC